MIPYAPKHLRPFSGGAAAAGGTGAGWDVGADEYGSTSGESNPSEFDVAGATYYAVAPTGYTYSGTQDTNYSTRKYNTLLAAEAAITGTLTAPAVINIIGDWTSDGPEDNYINVSLTTSAANFLLIRAIGTARHAGVWSTSAYILEATGAFGGIILNTTSNARVDGLQFIRTVSGASGYGAITAAGGLDVRISNCIMRGFGSGTEGAIQTAGSGVVNIWNVIAYNYAPHGIYCGGGTVNVYSSVFIATPGWSQGVITRSSGTLNCKNVYSAATNGYESFLSPTTLVTCASKDTTGSVGLQNVQPDATTFTNVGSGTEDYTLAALSPLIDTGTDTSGDTAPLDFTTDISGGER